MAERVKLEARPRERRGTREARRLRARGLVPAVVYGGGADPVAVALPAQELRRALGGVGGLHAVIDLTVDGSRARPVMVKDFQQDKVRGDVIHLDLHEIRLDRPVQAAVAVALTGEPEGVVQGGVLTQVATEVTVEALPTAIPDQIEVDVSGLSLGESVRLADVPVPDGVAFVDDPDETVIATVGQPTRVEEPEDVQAEGEEVEGVPEGEQAPGGAAESPLEPAADAGGSQGTVSG